MKRLSYSILLLLLTTVASGCSITFSSIAALDEMRAEQKARISYNSLDQLEPGTPLYIHKKDKNDIRGEFISLDDSMGGQMLYILVKNDTTTVPMSQINQVEHDRRHYKIWPAFLFGAAIDSFIIIMLVNFEPDLSGMSW